MNPLISVIIPVYNNQSHLKTALDSVFSQDYTPLQVIVINDGSSDESIDIIATYGSKIHLIHQLNSGPAAARNRGIKQATGELIAFLDADDVWLPWKLSTQWAYLREHASVGVVSNQWLVFEAADNQDLAESLARVVRPPLQEVYAVGPSGDLYTYLLLESIIHTSSVLLRREVFEQIGLFNQDLRLGEDYDYWLRASRLTNIAKLDCVLSVYRIHNRSIIHQPMSINYEARVVRQSLTKWGRIDRQGHEVSAKAISQRLADSWLNFVWGHYHHGNYKDAISGALNLIRYAPFSYRGWGYLVVSACKWLAIIIRP